jgi:hypothetical protein
MFHEKPLQALCAKRIEKSPELQRSGALATPATVVERDDSPKEFLCFVLRVASPPATVSEAVLQCEAPFQRHRETWPGVRFPRRWLVWKKNVEP